MYSCICGRSFEGNMSLNAHYSHCKEYRESKGLGPAHKPFSHKDGTYPVRKLKMVEADGYIVMWKPEHNKGNKYNYVPEHVLIVEKILGRPLYKDEVVHHIDENRKNNVPENLIVFRTKGDHTRFHIIKRQGKQTPIIELTEQGNYICKSINERKCTECGKEIDRSNRSKLCRTCKSQSIRRLKLQNIPAYTELKVMLENGESCLTLAKKYGTSYQTIRKRISRMI